METLTPQIFGAFVVDGLIAGVFTFFFLRNRQEYLRLWAIAFIFSVIRQGFAAIAILDQSRVVYDIVVNSTVVFAGLMLMTGTYRFLGRRLPVAWWAGAVGVGAWILATAMLDVSFLVATLPVFFFRALTDVVTGITLLRRRRGIGAWIAGAGFILWGLHRADFPFLRPVEWFAPWGFELASELGLFVAIGVLMMHYESLGEALAASEKKYRSMVESSLDGFIRTSVSGYISAANPALVSMLGYDSEEEMSGLSMADDVYADPEARRPFIESHVETGVVEGEPLRWKRKDGRVINVELTGKRVVTSEGEEVFEGSVRDVTGERELRAQLELSRRMESLGRLAGGIAHDFNNVLTAILAGADLGREQLAEGGDPSTELEAIRQSALQGADLSRRLLSFSRPDLQERAPMMIDRALEDAATMLRRLVPESIALQMKMNAGDACVIAEPGQIERVVMNLAINAQRAVEDDGRIVIETSVSDDGEQVVLAVRDTGIGMDAETVERIFEPFYTTGELGKGTGLGLATVFNVVNALSGTIEVDSEPGVGTEFRIVLPVCDEGVPANLDRGPQTESTPPLTSRPLVLLVEDEPLVRKIIKRTLESAGFETIVAGDGAEAREMLTGCVQDLAVIVTDVVMPKMSGPELLDEALQMRPDLPFLLLSGYTADKLEDRELTAEHFLEKPFTKAQLLGKIEAVRASPRPAALDPSASSGDVDTR